MMQRFHWVSLLLLCMVGIAAFQWPVENPVLTATFGEHRGDHFHNGIDIGGGAQVVRPVEAGEVVFHFTEGSHFDPLPTGLGNFLVVEHQQEYRSVYGHLEGGSLPLDLETVDLGDQIGTIGASGRSYGRHLHFIVMDSKIGQMINPLIVLPQVVDTVSPVIGEVFIRRNGETEIIENQGVLSVGKVHLAAHIYDPSEYVTYFCPMSPFQIEVYVDGRVFTQISYEALKLTGKGIVLVESEERTFNDLYLTHWDLDLGELTLVPGKTSLEILVRDFAGNQSARYLSFTVRE